MKKDNSFKCIFLVLLAVVFIIFSFKNSVYSKNDIPDIPVESNPRGIAINPNTDIAVVANEKADSVSVVNLNTQLVLSTIPVGKAPRGVAIDKGLNIALASNSKDNTISIIDLNTYQVTATISVGKEPEGITINQATHRAYAANHKDDTVSVIDLTNNSVIRTIPVGQEPKDVAIDSELNLALVVNEKDYNISVIDLNTHQVTGTVPVGQKPQAIAINPETHLAAVVNEKDNTVSLIDLSSYSSFRLDRNLSEGLPTSRYDSQPSGNDIRGSATTILVCKHPIDIAINQLDNRALVICDEDRSLLLIDLTPLLFPLYQGGTEGGVTTYPLNKLPKGIAVNNFTNIAAVVDDKTDSLTLIQLPNPIPEILAINPDTVLRGSSGETVNIQGNKFIKTSSVTLLHATPYTLHAEFIDNHNLQIQIPKEFLTDAGSLQITVTNPTPDGGISSPVNLQINNPVPSISAIDPLETKTNVQSLTLNVYGAGFFSDTEIYFGNVKKPISYISPTKLQISLTSEDLKIAGEYEITARNLSPGGGTSNKAIFTIKPSLEITITSPSDGDTINKAKTIVKGTFQSDTKDVGITINGILADVIPEGSNRGTSNQWIANNIPLSIGANTITATIKDSEGNTETASITINTADISQPVTLSANITSGIAPLQVFFSVSTSTFTPVSYQMDFEGDGIADYTGTTFENISHTYTSEGVFYPTITVTDNQNNTYSDTIAITVLNKTEIDTLLKGKWEGMKGEMASGNTESALDYFMEGNRDRYRKIFEELGDEVNKRLSEIIDVELYTTTGRVAQCGAIRIETGGVYAYPVTFVKDENGLWKIYGF